MKQSQEKNVSEEQATCRGLLSYHWYCSSRDSCKQPFGRQWNPCQTVTIGQIRPFLRLCT